MQRRRSLRGLLTALGLLLSAGCTSTMCEPEQLPSQGAPVTAEGLFDLVQYSAKHECWRTLYDAMSKRTRGEHAYIKLWAALRHIEVPEPWEYKLVDVLEHGTFVAAAPLKPGQELVIVSYQEPGKKELLAQILVVEEVEDGKSVRRMALEEQRHQGPAFNQDPG